MASIPAGISTVSKSHELRVEVLLLVRWGHADLEAFIIVPLVLEGLVKLELMIRRDNLSLAIILVHQDAILQGNDGVGSALAQSLMENQ